MSDRPRQLQDQIGRWTGFVVFALVVAGQFTFWPSLAAEPVELVRWTLLTLLAVLFWSPYWRRRPAIALASRLIEILLPLVCSALPLAQYPPAAVVHRINQHSPGASAFLWRPWLEARPFLGLSLMAAGEAFAVVSMLSLGRSLSIFSEVRELVTSVFARGARAIDGIGLAALDDGAALRLGDRWLVFTTDAHVIDPPFFPAATSGGSRSAAR